MPARPSYRPPLREPTQCSSCAINTLFWRLFSTPNIKTVGDLKNKNIGVTRLGTLEDGVLRYLLKERGLTRTGSDLCSHGCRAATGYCSKPRLIDASSFIAPQDIQAEKLGMHELIDMAKLGLYNPASCFATTKAYIHSNRDTVLRVMKAFVEGIRFYRDNREFALKVTADFAKNNDPEVLNASYNSVIRFQDKMPYVNLERHRLCSQGYRGARPSGKKFRSALGGRLELHPGIGKVRLYRRGLEKIVR